MEPAGRPACCAVAIPDLGVESRLVEPLRDRADAIYPRIQAAGARHRHRALLPPAARDADRALDAATAWLGRQRAGQWDHGAVGTPLPPRLPHGAAGAIQRLAPGPAVE